MKLLTKIKQKIQGKKNNFVVFFLTTFFLLLSATTLYSLIFNYWYQGRIFPGVFVGSTYVGGKNFDQASKKLNDDFYQFEQNGFTYQYNQNTIKIDPTIISPTDPDLVYELIKFDNKSSVVKALRVGRSGFWWQKIYGPTLTSLKKKTLKPDFILTEDKLLEILKDNLSKYEQPAQNASITWSATGFTLNKEQTGQSFNYKEIIQSTKEKISHLDNSPIKISLNISQPRVTLAEINTATKEQLTKLAKQKPLIIWKVGVRTYVKHFKDYKDYIELDKNGDKVIIKFNNNWLQAELEKIKKKVDQPSQDAKFEIKDGRVKEFQQSKDGEYLDVQKNIAIINNNLAENNYTTNLEIDIDRAKIQTADVNNLGITEIIGIGTSDFSGSPPNRVHNIKIGADSLNGLLIKPGEEFSLIKALLPIDSSKGYLPELVIKGNETIPEYGGGLCQIGTTAFRAALASGLPITQRRNHSYRVRYYEPAGTDATIYDPAPDFRFLNDTPGHILIQTKIEQGKLIFEYWGTSDGRQATSTKPHIYNITPPPPTKYIETLDLEPGEIKCTEKAHNGADAEFTYIVKFPDGSTKERTFKSHYRPWQEVCLKGVAELSTSTTSIIENQ